MLIATVLAASIVPARGWGVPLFGWLADIAILLLFFLHGAKLSRAAIVAGAAKWRLHLAVLGTSFILYPLLGLGAQAVALRVAPAMAAGLLYLSLLPLDGAGRRSPSPRSRAATCPRQSAPRRSPTCSAYW